MHLLLNSCNGSLIPILNIFYFPIILFLDVSKASKCADDIPWLLSLIDRMSMYLSPLPSIEHKNSANKETEIKRQFPQIPKHARSHLGQTTEHICRCHTYRREGTSLEPLRQIAEPRQCCVVSGARGKGRSARPCTRPLVSPNWTEEVMGIRGPWGPV